MNATVELVRKLSDSEIVGVVNELFRDVYTAVPYDNVRGNAVGVAEVDPLLNLDEDSLRRSLTAADSTRFGRILLEHYGADTAFEPLVRTAIEKVRGSDDLVVEVILAIGLVVNLTLLLATTSVKVEKGPEGKISWQITKSKASPDLVKAVVEPIVDVAKTQM